MTWVHSVVQDGWMERWGFRGRWLTVYLHRYRGQVEKTERFHRHPWRLCFGVLLFGWMREEVERFAEWWCIRRRRRWAPSIEWYWARDQHRIISGKGWSVFVGLRRTQQEMSPGATRLTREGWCHYTELNEGELARVISSPKENQ